MKAEGAYLNVSGGDLSALPIYRNYDELKFIVVSTIMNLIKRTKGNVLTFTAKKIAVHAGIQSHPVVLTLIKDVLENLRREGYIRRLARTSHGTKYIVDRNSALWRAAKGEVLVYELTSPYLNSVVLRLAKMHE